MMFSPLELSSGAKIAAALLYGCVFGFVLAKSGICRLDEVRNTVALRNMTVLKTFAVILLAGSFLFYLAFRTGAVNIHTAPSSPAGSILGGIFTGIGLALCGMTPLGILINLSSGKLHALWVFAGMILILPLLRRLSGVTSGLFSGGTFRFSAALPADFWSLSNPLLYIAVLCGGFLLIVCLASKGGRS